MTIQEIEKINKQFQSKALLLSELIPRTDMLEFGTLLRRKSVEIHQLFEMLIRTNAMASFWRTLEKMEEVMDDLVYELDRLHDLNNMMKINQVGDFIKNGYDMLSIYSISSDQVVKQKAAEVIKKSK